MPAPKRKRPPNLKPFPANLSFGYRKAELTRRDLLDGLLAAWPNLGKKALRKAQHKTRLVR